MKHFVILFLIVFIGLSCQKDRACLDESMSGRFQPGEFIWERARYTTPPKMTPMEFYDYLERVTLDHPNILSNNKDVYVPQNHTIVRYKFVLPDGVTWSKACDHFYFDVKVLGDTRGFGAEKLLGDLSAQASGIVDVNDVRGGQVVYFYPPSSWGFYIPYNDPNSIYSVIKDKKIKFIRGTVLE